MKQESKELLLKDLSGRLPYGVKIEVVENDDFSSVEVLDCFYLDRVKNKFHKIKPYLFPLSSMTEEQKKELWNKGWSIRYWDLCNDRYNGHGFEFVSHSDCRDLIDWLNKNHFDYRDLLSKGLAIDASNLNIY